MFSIKEAFVFGFNKTKGNWLILMLTALAAIAIGVIIAVLQKEISHSGLSIIGLVLGYLIEFFLSLIMLKIALIEVSGIRFTPKTISSITLEKYMSLVCLWILLFVFVTLGFLLIIPGIIISVRLSLSPWLLIDRGLSPMDAIKMSWRMTKGSFWKIFWVGVLSTLINILGVCLLGVGLLFTYPFTLISFGYVYKKLSEKEAIKTV